MTNLLYPYETYSGRVEMRLTGKGMDPVEAEPIVLDLYRIVDLSLIGRREWSLLQLDFEVSLSETGTAALKVVGNDHGILVEVECERTHARWTVQAEPTGEPHHWTARVELQREAVAGKVTMRPLLFANQAGWPRLLGADREEWVVHVDEPSIPIIEGSIKVIWREFATDEEYPILREYRDQAFFTDYGPDLPTLFLNRSFEGLPELLEDRRGRQPREQALHDLENVSVARTVWDGLFDVAAASLVVDEETGEVSLPETEWQQNVLRALLPRLYPDSAEPDALRQLRDDHANPSGVKSVESKTQVAIARQLNAHSKLATAIRRLLKGGDAG